MITVYSKPDCPACTTTYRVLDKLGVDYNSVNIMDDDSNFELVRDMGYSVVPVVVTPTESWSGLQVDKLRALSTK